MSTQQRLVVGVGMVIFAASLLSACQPTPTPSAPPAQPTQVPSTQVSGATPNDTSYQIEGEWVALTNGQASTPIPNSATTVDTMVWGQPTFGALTPTSTNDAAVLLTQQPGGSGTFFYVAAALETSDGYAGTNAILIGDRIAPQTLEVRDQIIVFNYATPPADAPLTAPASEGASKYFEVVNGTLTEIDQPVP